MSKQKLKKYLQTLTAEQIIEVVMDLYDARKDAKEFLEYYMNPDPAQALEKGKKSLFRNYFTPQGKTRARISTKTGNEIVADFIRLETDPETTADLLLYHIEVMMTRLVLRFISRETAWNSVITSFRKGIEYVVAYNLRNQFARRIDKIIDYSFNAPGYLNIPDRLRQELELSGYDKGIEMNQEQPTGA